MKIDGHIHFYKRLGVPVSLLAVKVYLEIRLNIFISTW